MPDFTSDFSSNAKLQTIPEDVYFSSSVNHTILFTWKVLHTHLYYLKLYQHLEDMNDSREATAAAQSEIRNNLFTKRDMKAVRSNQFDFEKADSKIEKKRLKHY